MVKLYLFVTVILVCNELPFALKRLALLNQEIVSIVHNNSWVSLRCKKWIEGFNSHIEEILWFNGPVSEQFF